MKKSLLRSVGILIIAALMIISCSPSGGQSSGTNTATKMVLYIKVWDYYKPIQIKR